MVVRKRIRMTGRIQGVGCRPFLYNAARELKLSGFVRNDHRGVTLEVQGPGGRVKRFVKRLQDPASLPPAMRIEMLDIDDVPVRPESAAGGSAGAFVIEPSAGGAGDEITQVSVDTAVCGECLAEMCDPQDRRYRYAFINCTQCGPRYTIVRRVPYDRPNTTMAGFEMCPACRAEYTNPADRRFHAQPVACPVCGPRFWLVDATGGTLEDDPDRALGSAAVMLRDGRILAIKGLGGFHLAVNAFDDAAVMRLRERKRREHKPFAMMARSVDVIRRYAVVDSAAAAILESASAPIVLLPRKAGPSSAGVHPIAPGVAPGTATWGFMLCYAPLHHLLFAQEGIELLVMTSGNLSEEPLICDNSEALERLGVVADAFILHDRDIHRRIDDSVVQIVGGQASPIRRARGYVPGPVLLDRPCPQDVFAAGGDLKNTFCLVKGRQMIVSEHIGDLADARSLRHYKASIRHLAGLFEVRPQVVVCDLHPGYLSSQHARQMDVDECVEVQHHWAHVAAVLAEHRVDTEVIGLVADGTGYGTDGAIWGCECLIASLEGFRRFGHLRYYPLPGGDLAARQAIRPLMGLIRVYTEQQPASGAWEPIPESWERVLSAVEPDAARRRICMEQIAKQVNTVQTSSLGRLFDAVAAIAGLGRENRFEAELPMALEAAVDPMCREAYPIPIEADFQEQRIMDFVPLLEAVMGDAARGTAVSTIAARFHNALVEAFVAMAVEAREACDIKTVALSGGVFCNRYLAGRLMERLKSRRFTVLWPTETPVNDGGIALGQAAIAARRLLETAKAT